MAIYTRFGSTVELTRAGTIDDVKALENRKPDKHDRERLEIGAYVVGKIVSHRDGSKADPKDRLFDTAMLKADGGSLEINAEAKRVGCVMCD